MTVRAAVLTAPRALVLEEVALPAPAAGEVVLDVAACGICATNLHGWNDPARALAPARAPGAHGHEVAGTVRGSGARVCLDPALACACGACDRCAAGDPVGCRDPHPPAVWGFADAMVVPARALVPVPDGLELATASLAEPLASAVHGLRHGWAARESGRVDGAHVAVVGAGPLGLLALAAARHLGAAETTIAARHEHQARAAAELGADRVLDAGAPDLARTLRRLRPQVVVEAVGGGADTLALAFAAVDRGGEVVVLGLFDEPRPLDVTDAVLRGVRASFSAAYATRDGVSDFGVALEVLRAEPRLAGLVRERLPLERVAEAFALAAAHPRATHRVLVTPNENQPTVC